MMLAASALSSVTASAATVFSPCANTCMKRVSATRFRYEPYGSLVISSSLLSTPVSNHWKSLASPTVTAEMPRTVLKTASAPVTTSAIKSITAPSPISATTSPSPSVAPMPAASCDIKNNNSSAAAAEQLPRSRYAVIRFKQETFTFVAPFRTVVGDTVVVEGDRGENIGVVVEITQVVPAFEVTNRILRIATEKDMAALAAQREREASVKKAVQSISSSIGLHATIEDVEYQFDLNKLTIFVRRPAKGGFVDFRKLQRSLFREFRCRIWCAYMDEVEAVENGPRIR